MNLINHNNQNKIMLINDISGFGRCSAAVQLPIISHLKVQCCVVPTSIFSEHTGFPHYYFDDYTEHMEEYASHWKKLGLEFKGICTGFLGSHTQIDIVDRLIREFRRKDTIVTVDPVMGDYGKKYSIYTDEMCSDLKNIIRLADIITPNLTEACILTGREYNEARATDNYLEELAAELCGLGPEKVVITGVPEGKYLKNLVYERGKQPAVIKTRKIGESRSGTGDVFSAIISADAVNGVPFEASVRKAVNFISECIIRAVDMEIPLTDGVPFEEVIYKL
jgi:pyridoxine kinase